MLNLAKSGYALFIGNKRGGLSLFIGFNDSVNTSILNEEILHQEHLILYLNEFFHVVHF